MRLGTLDTSYATERQAEGHPLLQHTLTHVAPLLHPTTTALLACPSQETNPRLIHFELKNWVDRGHSLGGQGDYHRLLEGCS